ncbi:hypothetical protein AYO20_05950 [Fonsecaea nubica]|uniref:HORMA domain-containing protein n=1 Tax=Fonsecaea nubica TaxID=856822 RepID=A0A178D0T9_9EURO|nr:hypothetical protein AYO20_05950 [Fonsecaea nubica]OAL34755.1 hypothetical protein AYO20_05950 [Fonsecaea nubica]
MAGPLPNPATSSNFLSTRRALFDTLASFLTVATHHILYLRRIYPPVSFLAARAYNCPVRQNRHPAVCTWVNDAVAAVRDQLDKNTVEKVLLCIYECESNRVLERWTFDLGSFSSTGLDASNIHLESSPPDDGDLLSDQVNLADLEANFRATLSRISTSAARLRPLPEGPGAPECSFTLAIEVKDRADRPVGRIEKEERKWIAAEPQPNPSSATPGSAKDERGSTTTSPRTHAVRRVEVGELQMEVWVEEAAAKFEFSLPSTSSGSSLPPEQRAANMSYGAGKEKFDPENMYAYDLEPPDVNRKPQGGATTDYQRG